MSDVAMRIMLSVVGSGAATAAIRDVGKALSGSGGLAGGLAIAGAAAAAAAVAIGVTAVKAAGDFEAQTTRLVTSAGELQSNLDLVRQGILQMSVDTATSTEQLAQGMYYVESAGYRARDALTVLAAAAQGAKSENAALDVVSKALTTEMIDYHMSANQAAEAMNGLIAAVANGNTNLQTLSASMGAVLPIASSLGINFANVAGVMDEMTNHGMTARQAAQNLAHVLLALSAPSGVAVKAMKEVGLSAQGVKDAMVNQGLPEALQMIEDQVGKKFPAGSVAYETALKNILGGIVGVKLAAQLTGASLSETEQHIKAVTTAMKNGHGAVSGFALVQQTLNFKLDQAKQAFNVLLITIGTALLPVVSNIVGHVSEAIGAFAKWLTEGDKLKNALHAVGTVLQGVAGFIGNVVSVGAKVVSFFQHSQVAALALLIPLGMIGTVLASMAASALVDFLSLIPFLVIEFIDWAVTAGAAAIATIAATWPVLAIGAAIGAVIAIIILLVTHWKQVTAFLTGVWKAVSTWFMNSLHAIGQFFSNVWNGILGFLKKVWQDIVLTVQTYLTILVNVFTAPFKAIGALFGWLYNHNYYFKKLIDSIRLIVKMGLDWLKGVWTTVVNWLVGVWNTIARIASTVWNAVTTAIKVAVTTVWNWLVGVWTTITGWIGKQWDKLKGLAKTAWDGVVGVFKGIWGTISGALGSLWNNISSWFGNLAKQALQWGKNMIQGFINGITGMIGNVANAAKNVISSVASFLGFHSPAKMGPGAELEQWPKNLIASYAAGLQKAIPHLQTSLNLVMRPVAGALSGQGLAPAAMSRGGGAMIHHEQHFHVSINTNFAPTRQQAQAAVDMVEQELGRRVRGQTPGYNSGGVF